MKMGIEDWWNDIDGGKPKYSGKILSHFVHQKSGGERPATTRLNCGAALPYKLRLF